MSQPLVSIVTPVYNGQDYLVECIESVLAQTYQHWEYLIVDNCSTDATIEIATRYAKRDARIRLCSFSEFVTLVQNFNRAVSLISSQSQYCKVLPADDWLFPRCIESLVTHGELHPSVGIIGSYQLSGGDDAWLLKYAGMPYPSARVEGSEACRWHLLGKPYVFGTPASVIYRSHLVRNSTVNFFPGPPDTMHSDRSACYEHLSHSDFGFVHEVLSFERVHEAAASTTVRDSHSYTPGILRDLLTYGPRYLSQEEFEQRREDVLREYYDFLSFGAVRLRERAFWRYHRDFLASLGYPLVGARLAHAVASRVLDKLLNPKKSVEILLRGMRNALARRKAATLERSCTEQDATAGGAESKVALRRGAQNN